MPLNQTLADTLQFDGWEGAHDLLDECTVDTPTISGYDKHFNRSIPISVDETDQDTIKTMVRVELPKTDPFRIANEGVGSSKGKYEERMFQLATATWYWHADKSIVDKNPARGAKYMQSEGVGILASNCVAMEEQFFYGQPKSKTRIEGYGFPKGFQGLANFVDPEMVIDAGGTGDYLTSAWFVWWNPKGIEWVYGSKGSVQLSEPKIVDHVETIDGETRKFPAYQQYLEFYPAITFRSRWSCARVVNIDVGSAILKNGKPARDVNTNHITDLVFRQVTGLFPPGAAPNVIYMQPSVNLLLAASRSTATLINGKSGTVLQGSATAPSDNFEGIPIVYTKQIQIGEPHYIQTDRGLWVPEKETDAEPETPEGG